MDNKTNNKYLKATSPAITIRTLKGALMSLLIKELKLARLHK
jgi:hypothetical protein